MSRPRKESDPYVVLGVERDATLEQIVEAYRQKKFEATRSDPSKVIHIDAAFGILKDSEQREEITQTLFKKDLLEGMPDDQAKNRSTKRRSLRAAQFKSASLAVLMVVLGVTTFLALKHKDAVCPSCEHYSVTGQQLSQDRVEFSCNRVECKFSYTYETEADEEDEHEAEALGQARLTE
jgi:hypothetical protein